MKSSSLLVITLVALAGSAFADVETYKGSRYSEVWQQVSSDPYRILPQYKVSFSSMYGVAESKIRRSAERTLSNQSDLLPPFRKLVHPNGICLTGTWNITRDNPYTGYFSKDSKALIIARASSAMSETKRGEYRSFGLAGKIYPTDDRDHMEPLKTANFFTVDDLGGTQILRYTDTPLLNEPKMSKRLGLLGSFATLSAIIKAFRSADGNPGYRPLYPIAKLGMEEPSASVAPKWMMLKAAPGQSFDIADFRHELRVRNYGGKLVFDILVSDSSQDGWQNIGNITFTDDAISQSCDQRLHFAHPRLTDPDASN
jgi:hypothetical protein